MNASTKKASTYLAGRKRLVHEQVIHIADSTNETSNAASTGFPFPHVMT